jgi:ribosome biogenesis GTPase A
VSVSRTPGHTKYFQTIFLTENVRLVDCPGLVFPSSTPKILQVLLGSFPISQIREPYASIKYLAERVDLPKLLALVHPEKQEEWSAMDICDAFAIKRGFYTAKAARPDSYRAANSILRFALDGKICLSLKPKGYNAKKEFWESHEELEKVKEIQSLGKADTSEQPYEYSDDEDEDDEEEKKKKAQEKESDSDGDDEEEEEEEATGSKVSNAFALLNDESDD